MNFSITLNGEMLQFTDQLSPELLAQKVFPVNYVADGSWGSLHFQALVTKEFAIWYSIYDFLIDATLHIKVPMESTGLHFTLKNTLRFETTEIGTIVAGPNQFNLTHMPVVDTTGYFTPGQYISFDISYHSRYLTRYVPFYNGLEQFTQNVENKIASRLHPDYLVATPEMIAVINSILRYDYDNALSPLYIGCKAQELLILSVEKLKNEANKKIPLSDNDIKRTEAIYKWLTENIDFSGSLADLAQQFQTNDFKLKRGFKELYGTTVFDRLFVLRMERAKKMLLETTTPVTEIGYRAGYSSGSHFSDAFRKHFGYPPTFLRKK